MQDMCASLEAASIETSALHAVNEEDKRGAPMMNAAPQRHHSTSSIFATSG